MDNRLAQYAPVEGRKQPYDMPSGLLGHGAEDDRVRAAAESSAAYERLIKNPYAYDNMAIAAGRYTPGGYAMGLLGLYPESANGPLVPSVMENIDKGNYNNLADQALGTWGSFGKDAISGFPWSDSLLRSWLNKPK